MDTENMLDITDIRNTISAALGVSQQAITNWKVRGIPGDKCPDIELLTDGRYSVEDMRPDLKWHRVKDKSWPNPKGRPLMDVTTQAA